MYESYITYSTKLVFDDTIVMEMTKLFNNWHSIVYCFQYFIVKTQNLYILKCTTIIKKTIDKFSIENLTINLTLVENSNKIFHTIANIYSYEDLISLEYIGPIQYIIHV